MIDRLDWFAAPFEAHGGTAGEGARRLLGQPNLDPLTVLVRETLQNSWDARGPSGDPIRYSIHLRTLNSAERGVLSEQVFAQGLGHGGVALPEALARHRVRVLEISDSGTTGLAGPTRADLKPDSGQSTDFVDFVFNIGAARDTHLGGGTYGFGKTIAFVVSQASTMLISSCVRVRGGHEQRFIASSIGSEFARNQRLYTGRQWWGCMEDGRIGPATGALAQRMSSALGLETGRPGTSLLIVDPDLRGRTPEEAMKFLTSSLLWHAWPKMVPGAAADHPSVLVSASLEGEPFAVPDPLREPRLTPFVTALQQVRATQSGAEQGRMGPLPTSLSAIGCGRPKQDLGHLGLAYAPNSTGVAASVTDDDEVDGERRTDACPFAGPSHHTALMRQAELIVSYEEGPPSSVEGFQWGGAFRPLQEVDDHFAMAEPPAHEGWDPEFVQDAHGRTFVRVALRRLKEAVRDFAAPSSRERGVVGVSSTGRIGDLLAGIIPSVEGTASNSRRGRTGGSSGTRKRKDRIDIKVLRTNLKATDYGPQVDVEISVRSNNEPLTLVADVGIRNDTGREASAPEGTHPPRLGLLMSREGIRVEPDSEGRYMLPENSAEEWTLTIFHPEPAALDVKLETEKVRPERSP